MIKSEVIIGVKNLKNSSEWYQTLLGCGTKNVSDAMEILVDKDDDTAILCLHKWGATEHSTLISPNVKAGNGIILLFRVENLQQVWDNARDLYAVIEEVPYENPDTGKPEFSLRDIDGYYVSISEG